MKTILTLLCAAFTLNVAYAQIPVELQDYQINGNFLATGLSMEKRISDNQSITLGLSFTPLYEEYTTGVETHSDFGMGTTLYSSFRNYYDRNRVRKELRKNSGNYVGALVLYNFDVIGADRDVFFDSQFSKVFEAGVVWGFQRNYQSGIHLGLSIGLGVTSGGNQDLDMTIPGTFEFGFVLGPRKEIKAKKL